MHGGTCPLYWSGGGGALAPQVLGVLRIRLALSAQHATALRESSFSPGVITQ
jgi:hypothetical protein